MDAFKLDLKALAQGDTALNFDLDDAFFEGIEAAVLEHGKLATQVTVHRQGDVFGVDLHTEGHVIVTCDRCLDDMEQPIESDEHLTVKLGPHNSDDGDVLTVDENEGVLDLSWYIYEAIALAVPLRHVHAPGKCNPAMTKVLDDLSATRSGSGDDAHPEDDRWAALKNLNPDNN